MANLKGVKGFQEKDLVCNVSISWGMEGSLFKKKLKIAVTKTLFRSLLGY